MVRSVGRVPSGEAHLLGGVAALAGEFHMPAGRIRLAQDGPKVLEAQLAPIPEGPGGLRETGEIGLRVDFAARPSSIAIASRKMNPAGG